MATISDLSMLNIHQIDPNIAIHALPIKSSFERSSKRVSLNNTVPTTNVVNVCKLSPTSPKHQPEETLRKLLFKEESSLLHAYCDSLLKNSMSPGIIAPILNFYSSRGKINLLLTEVGKREIRESKQGTPLFRGNTPFTRLYSYYLFLHCGDFMTKTTIFLIDQTGLYNAFSQQTNDGAWVKEFIKSYSEVIRENIGSIPYHQRKIIKELVMNESFYLDQSKKKQIFSTLLFLRYLYVPFLKQPQILKILQQCVSEWIKEEGGNKSERRKTDSYVEFKNTLDYLYENIMLTPVGFDVGMINLKQQEQSLNDLIDIIKENLFLLSSSYKEDFQEIFVLVKGKQEVDTTTNMDFATEELKQWTGGKLEVATQLNVELRMKINELTKRNERIKQRITFISTYTY